MVVYFKEVEMCAVLSLTTVPALEQVSRDGCLVTRVLTAGGSIPESRSTDRGSFSIAEAKGPLCFLWLSLPVNNESSKGSLLS